MNHVKVFVLMAGLTGLVMAIGQSIGGNQGATMALLLSAAMNLFMYWGSSTHYPSTHLTLRTIFRLDLHVVVVSIRNYK